MVIARKNKQVAEFHTPQQSDYVSAWRAHIPAQQHQGPPPENAVRERARRILPTPVKTWLRRIVQLTRKREEVEGLGKVDTRHFKRVDF